MSDRSEEHDRWREELPAYVLGALSPGDAEACARHIEVCEACSAEARWLTPAVDRIPQDTQRVEPPAGLRERIMAEVKADAGARSPSPRAKPSFFDRFGGLGLRQLAGITAVLLVCVAVAGYWVGSGGSPGDPATTTYVEGQSPAVTATVVREGDTATLSLANVDPLSERRVLQAWVQRGDQIEPVPALFAPDRGGEAKTIIEDMYGVEAVMVTTEPAGGSEAPTEDPFVRVEIPG